MSQKSHLLWVTLYLYFMFLLILIFFAARLPEDKSALCVHEIKLVIQPCPRLTYCCSVGQRTYCSLHLRDKRYFYLFISINCCFSLFHFSIQLSIIYLLSLFFLGLTFFLLCSYFASSSLNCVHFCISLSIVG